MTKQSFLTVADVFSLSPEDILDTFAGMALKGMEEVKRDGVNYVYRAGTIPVLLVAHVDTVLPQPKKESVRVDKRFMYSTDGHLGGDDRAGVLMILNILKLGYRPHVLLTNFEECGGMGAEAAAKDLAPDVKFVIELDRMGEDDAVYYGCSNAEFQTFIESFGFLKQWGSFSDISILCPKWDIAGVNLSIGYYRPHSHRDFVEVPEYIATIKKVIAILKTSDLKAYDYGRKAKSVLYDWEDKDLYDFRMGQWKDRQNDPIADLWRTDPFYYSERVDGNIATEFTGKSKRKAKRDRDQRKRDKKSFGTIGRGTIGKNSRY